MANTTIAIKKSATYSSIPSTLEFGELAINYADGKLYYKNVSSSIVEFSPKANSFGIINASSTLVIADGPGNILTFISGNNISILGDAVNDTITFSANIAPAFDKANSANVLAFNTGVGANAFTSATISGANTSVGAGANSYASFVGTAANTFTSSTIAGANTAVGIGANSYADIVGTSSNAFTSSTIAGANTAVGAGANAFTSSTIAGANTAVGAGANAFTSATIAGANTISVAAFAKANSTETIAIAGFSKANTAETTAIAAFAKSNSSGGGIAISTDNTTNDTFYVTLSKLTTGTATTLNVATTKLTFNPSTGTLSATVFNSLSDLLYKTNVKTLVNSLDVVDNLRGVSFNWKDGGQASIGVIAQEIETYVPALVTDNNGIKNVNYDGIIGLLIESIKELKDKVEVLEAKEKNGMSE